MKIIKVIFFIILIFSSTAYCKCAGWWKLNDNAASNTVLEEIGAYNGTASTNTSTLAVTGKMGGALTFNGSDQSVAVDNNTALHTIKQQWTKYASNPVLTKAGDAFTTVAKVGNTYHSWGGSSNNIYHSTSTDGIVWGNRATCTGISNASVSSVWYENGQYRMLYRRGGGSYTVINYATSDNGLAWTNRGTKISQTESWETGYNIDPWGVIKVGSTYYLWYNNIGDRGGRKTGLATATDPSGTWTKDADNPIWTGGRFCAWTFKYGSFYYCLIPHYTSSTVPDEHAEIELWRCPNPTFYSTEREFIQIAAHCNPDGTSWDEDELDTPCVLTDDVNRNTFTAANNQLWMYYAGEAGTTWKTGLTQETDFVSALAEKRFSIAFWMKHSSTTNAVSIMSQGDTSDYYGWKIQNKTPSGKGNGNIAFGSSQGYVATQKDSNNDWNDNAWHFVVCTWAGIDDSTAKINVDGVLQTTEASGTFVIGMSQEPISFGCRYSSGGPSKYWAGTLDNITLFDHELTQGEINYLYNDGYGKAFAPNPADGARGVDTDVVLSWSPGYIVASHDVYFGTDYNDVNDADTSSPEYKGSRDVNNFDPCGLNLSTTYYWRIDEVNDSNVWKGDVWSFERAGDADGILYVPSEYPTIRAAIDVALDGDTVIVSPGIYTGAGNRDLDFGGEAITVRSTDPEDPNVVAATVIDCELAYGHRGFYFHSGEGADSIVSGLTITRGFQNSDGGGIRCEEASPTISYCVIRDNVVRYVFGGGMSNVRSSPTVTNCTFSGNQSVYGPGGGMSNRIISSPTLINCRFIGNWTQYKWGGGMYNDGSSPTLVNCAFSGNSAVHDGGGMYNSGSAPTLTNCTFSGNEADYGGGMLDSNSSPTLVDCILWGNTAPYGPQIYNSGTSSPAISFSDVQGGWTGTGNIDADPYFVTGPDGDYYLSQIAAGQAVDSPCVDAGSDTSNKLGMVIFTTRTDKVGDGGIVDMGYHYSMPNPADIDGDGDVDFVDFAILASQWQQAPGVPSADIAPPGGDGIVDILDLGLLADNWLAVNY